jgi:hypothetical protein
MLLNEASQAEVGNDLRESVVFFGELAHLLLIVSSRDLIVVVILLNQVDEPDENIELFLVFKLGLFGWGECDGFHNTFVDIMLGRLTRTFRVMGLLTHNNVRLMTGPAGQQPASFKLPLKWEIPGEAHYEMEMMIYRSTTCDMIAATLKVQSNRRRIMLSIQLLSGLARCISIWVHTGLN